MFATHTPEDTRALFFESWQKYQDDKPTTPLESQILEVILAHPEYHNMLSDPNELHKNYFPELGETNPFLHMGLHIAIREQVSTNRPEGIKAAFQALCQQFDSLEAEHRLMNCLAECLYLAQKNQTIPDQAAYLKACQSCI